MTAKETGLRWFDEVWNQRNLEAIPELLAADAAGHLEGGQEITGPEEFATFQRALLAALPDVRVEVLRVLGDGDEVCVLWLASATHTGHGLNLSPTGKKLTFRGMTWFHVRNGQIAEGWDAWNIGGLLQAMSSPA